VVDVSPKLFDRVVGVNVIEAMILAALASRRRSLGRRLHRDPRRARHQAAPAAPHRQFRNIRRFAFVIHPLSQEFIKKGFPIPKATPKFVMDKVETLAAHMPPMVYCKMENIVSPTGAEAEGWLISVGGTPKEMLARSPEFTYRRLLRRGRDGREAWARRSWAWARSPRWWATPASRWRGARRCPSPPATATRPRARCGPRRRACAHGPGARSPKGTGTRGAKTMVIGATGSIGSVSARLLAMAFDEVYIAGRDLPSSSELKAIDPRRTRPTPRWCARPTTTPLLGDMDMIVTATSGAGKKILDIMKVKPGCVITDVARPLDLPARGGGQAPRRAGDRVRRDRAADQGQGPEEHRPAAQRDLRLPGRDHRAGARRPLRGLHRRPRHRVGKGQGDLQARHQARHEAGGHLRRERRVQRRGHRQGGHAGQEGWTRRAALPPG
jgi:hypothetical protein